MDECKNNIIQKSNMYDRFEDINLKVHVILFTFDFWRYFLVCISRYDFRRVYWRYNYRAENVIGSQISKTLYVYWVYLVPMILRKHTLYNIRYLSFEWICIYTSILWYEVFTLCSSYRLLTVIRWHLFFTLTSFRCTGNSLLWRAIWDNMLDCCGGVFISDIFEPNQRIFYYYNSV